MVVDYRTRISCSRSASPYGRQLQGYDFKLSASIVSKSRSLLTFKRIIYNKIKYKDFSRLNCIVKRDFDHTRPTIKIKLPFLPVES